jgi:hypothetical protein
MKAVSLWQPWASFVALRFKWIETRSWPAPRADCVPMIDATDTVPGRSFMYVDPDFVQIHDGPDDNAPRYIEDQLPYGDFAPGRWAWLLADIEPLDEPVPAKGRQGIWEWTP